MTIEQLRIIPNKQHKTLQKNTQLYKIPLSHWHSIVLPHYHKTTHLSSPESIRERENTTEQHKMIQLSNCHIVELSNYITLLPNFAIRRKHKQQ